MNREQKIAAEQLGHLIADYHVEASRWENRGMDAKGQLIRGQAHALDAVRVDTILDMLSDDEAFAWLDIGRRILVEHVYHRCVNSHPARRVTHTDDDQ